MRLPPTGFDFDAKPDRARREPFDRLPKPQPVACFVVVDGATRLAREGAVPRPLAFALGTYGAFGFVKQNGPSNGPAVAPEVESVIVTFE